VNEERRSWEKRTGGLLSIIQEGSDQANIQVSNLG
jgi:hypothetical protein